MQTVIDYHDAPPEDSSIGFDPDELPEDYHDAGLDSDTISDARLSDRLVLAEARDIAEEFERTAYYRYGLFFQDWQAGRNNAQQIDGYMLHRGQWTAHDARQFLAKLATWFAVHGIRNAIELLGQDVGDDE